MRVPVVGCLASLMLLAAGCSEKDEPPPPQPYDVVASAAQRTVAASPVRVRLSVRAFGAERRPEYKATGTLELRRHRYRVQMDKRDARELDAFMAGPIVGMRESTVSIGNPFAGPERLPRRVCGFDPHLPMGTVDGLVSLEQSTELVWALARGLRRPKSVVDSPDLPIAVASSKSNVYGANVARGAILKALPREAGWMVEDLWSSLEQPVYVSVDAAGDLGSIWTAFHRPEFGARRERAAQDVWVTASFGGSSGPLKQPRLDCIAME